MSPMTSTEISQYMSENGKKGSKANRSKFKTNEEWKAHMRKIGSKGGKKKKVIQDNQK